MIYELLLENVKTTRFMQHCDVFPKNKFAGRLVRVQQDETQTAKELLETFLAVPGEDVYKTVGALVHGGDACILPGYDVYSSEREMGWVTVDKICEKLGCKLERYVPAEVAHGG